MGNEQSKQDEQKRKEELEAQIRREMEEKYAAQNRESARI